MCFFFILVSSSLVVFSGLGSNLSARLKERFIVRWGQNPGLPVFERFNPLAQRLHFLFRLLVAIVCVCLLDRC